MSLLKKARLGGRKFERFVVGTSRGLFLLDILREVQRKYVQVACTGKRSGLNVVALREGRLDFLSKRRNSGIHDL